MKYNRNFYQIKSNQEIFEKIKNEKKIVGHYKLPYENLDYIHEFVATIQTDRIYVVGIGGSTLGTQAIYEFLKNSILTIKDLVFLDSTDPVNLKDKLKNLSNYKPHFIFISKSGNTIEPLSILNHISCFYEINSENSSIISVPGSNFEKFAIKNKINFFGISPELSGRFSIFSAVGLLPLCMSGIDINEIIRAAKSVFDDFFDKGKEYKEIINKARFFVENKARFNINVIFSYSKSLESFNKWYVQLWAESLGKKNINATRQGLNPIALIGPDDQHSFLQLIIDGVRDKTITFIKINDMNSSEVVAKKTGSYSVPDINFSSLSFESLINMQADSTIEAIEAQGDIPYDVITMEKINEYEIAKLISKYQLLVSCIGAFLQINTYNQPGVELGKKNLIKRINR